MNAKDALAGALTTAPTVIRRQDYTPPSHKISHVRLDFTLGVESTTVINDFDFESGSGAEGPISLHGDELTFVSVAVDGVALKDNQYSATSQELRIHTLPAKGRLTITTQISPKANTALMGLYASRGGLFTQCESEGFRRITYFLDRPDVMAVYDVVMRGRKSEFPVMLSNGNLIAEKELNAPGREGWHEAHWQDPFPKPSYLFALVAADLDRIEETITTQSGKKALLQVYTRKEDLAQADFAMQSLKRAIFWDERRYGLELDLERFMVVAVPDFNSGAMENKGLNLFNTKYVLADPQTATDIDYDGIESVVAHEYFHNWTGNRITCRDWFQLTLKEGLTVFRDSEFSADMASENLSPKEAASARAVRRIDAVRTLRTHQFPEDAGPMSHPIRPDSYQEIRNFYTMTVYEKGAEVIRMLQTILGVDGFRKGMDLYFARHDGQAVTCDAFVHAMFDANQRTDAEPFMRWYDTSGTPRLVVCDDFDAASGQYSLHFQQEISQSSPSQKPLMIPVSLGLIDRAGQTVSMTKATVSGDAVLQDGLLLIKGDRVSMSVSVTEKPVPSLLRDFSAPVALDYAYQDDQLLHLLAFDTDPFNRWEAGQRLMQKAILHRDQIDLSAVTGAFAKLIADPALDHGYKASMLALPSEAYLAEQMHEVDPGFIRSSRDQLRLALTQALKESLLKIDQELRTKPGAAYFPDPISTGRRCLANLAQHWLAIGGVVSSQTLLERYRSVNNMTDRMAVLGALVELDTIESETALAAYLDQFRDHALAMDKWFTVQVTMKNETALDRVRGLMSHALFDVSNPNRVRSVLGAYFNANLPGFHRQDGAGYALWAEQVLAIDARNSQLASRMARALDRWSHFEPIRRAAMKAALEKVAAHESLSSDVREVVTKALG